MTTLRKRDPALPPRVLRLEDAAAYLGTNRTDLDRLTKQGDLPDFRLFAGGPRRWLRDDLDAYIEARRQPAQPALTLQSCRGGK